MGRADTITLLPIDRYAEIMSIHPNAWNQVVNASAPTRHNACNDVWLQHGYQDTSSDRTTGREDIAQAIATAEEAIARTLGFWPAPCWITNEAKRWPRVRRGCAGWTPRLETRWGWVLAGGQQDVDTVILNGAPIVYSDEDGDGVLDTATITITAAQMTAASATLHEIAVYYPDSYLGMSPYPVTERWRIRPLRMRTDTGTGDIQIVGHRAQLVDPALWEASADIDLDTNGNFLTQVDVRRRYNNTEEQAQLVWKPTEATLCTTIPACSEVCQDGCIVVDEYRPGHVRILPGTYAAGAWTYAQYTVSDVPSEARLWYYGGWYRNIDGWMEADWMQAMLAEAIVRLANVYMPDIPCGCDLVARKWERDREEQDINNIDAARAMSSFGSSARGALFAWGVVKRMDPIAGAGAL